MFPFIDGVLVIFLFSGSLKGAEDPFWKKKPHVYEKVKKEHWIAVSARAETLADKKRQFQLSAGGHFRAPASFVLAETKNFNAYPDILPLISEVKTDQNGQILYLKGSLIGRPLQATMALKPAFSPLMGFSFLSISGALVGLKGELSVVPISDEISEVGLSAHYLAEAIFIPAALINLGLEITMQRACGQMRQHVESRWKKHKNPRKSSF